jgi:hypothetical protein
VRKEIAQNLRKRAEEVAERYSQPGERSRAAKEGLKVDAIEPLSDNAAAVIFIKDTGIRTVALFFYLSHSETWNYLFPTDGHTLGFSEFPRIRREVEKLNIEAIG